MEAAKVEAAKNTIANLTGKVDAMQAQIQRQADELARCQAKRGKNWRGCGRAARQAGSQGAEGAIDRMMFFAD